jgi:hypothetical protein
MLVAPDAAPSSELAPLVRNPDARRFTIDVSDRLGDHDMVGAAVITYGEIVWLRGQLPRVRHGRRTHFPAPGGGVEFVSRTGLAQRAWLAPIK